ncbi:MAG: metal-dependent hydrolase [Promethearchaeota archaeon]
MKNEEHMIMGFCIALFVGVYGQIFDEYFDFILYIIFVGLTVFGSVVPNLIEPPHKENHRQFFHSVVILVILAILLIWLIIGRQSMFTYLLSGFILGYLSHLLFDATSQERLPKY